MNRSLRLLTMVGIVGALATALPAAGAHASEATCKVTSASLRVGARGAQVRCLQQALNGVYQPDPAIDPAVVAVDGVFGARTRAVVVRFQRDHRLQADGIAGPATLAALRIKMRRPTEHGFASITAGRLAVEKYIERTNVTLLRGARMRSEMAAVRAKLEGVVGRVTYGLNGCAGDNTCLWSADGRVAYLEVSFVRSTDGSWVFGEAQVLSAD